MFRKNTSPPEPTAADRQQLITGTLARYQSRRKQKLTSDVNFELDLELKYIETKTKDKVHEKRVIKPGEASIGDYNDLFKTFYTKIRRLLILGAPGSGKTVLLLRLAEFLMDKSQDGSIFPVPILVNLASWRSDEPDFETWLEKQLPHSAGEGGISKDYAKYLVDTNQVLPLLDGLDEIPEAHRASVLEALEVYLAKRQGQSEIASSYPEVIICCRKEEYEALDVAPEIYGTILIQPLSDEKIRETLDELVRRNNTSAERLLLDLEKYPHFKAALNTAFFVHIALGLYAIGRPKDDFFKVFSAKAQQDQLIATYLQQQLNLLDKPTHKSRRWLGWLSSGLQRSKKGVSFELADLQISWLGESKLLSWIYWLSYGLGFGIIVGLPFGLTTGILYGPLPGLLAGLAVLILGVLFVGLGEGITEGIQDQVFLSTPILYYPDIIFYDFKNLTPSKLLKDSLFSGLLFGTLAGTLSWLIAGGIIFIVNGSLKDSIIGFQFGLTLGIFFGIIRGFFAIITEIKHFAKVEKIYQRLTTDLLHLAIQFSIIVVLGLITIKLQTWSDFLEDYNYFKTFLIGTAIGLVSSFFVSNLYNYTILHLIFVYYDVIPLRLVPFLNQVADKTGLMEKDGGQWRFRHQLIQDALAKEFESNSK
jgi:hypothetical protein